MVNSRAHPISQLVVKKVTETVNNSTTPQNDDELFLKVKANKWYKVELILLYVSTAVADLNIKFTLPSGGSGWYNFEYLGSLSTAMVNIESGKDILTSGSASQSTFAGYIKIGTTGGTFQLQWSQKTAEATNSDILLGSSLQIWESP